MNNKIFKIILSICIVIGVLLIGYGIYEIINENMNMEEIIETAMFLPFFGGIMFIIVPVMFLLFGDEKEEKNKRKRILKAYCFNGLAGFMLIVIGFAACFGICEQRVMEGYTLKAFFESVGVIGLFPFLFFGFGGLLIVYPLVQPKHKKINLTVSDIYEINDKKVSIVLDDEKYKKENLNSKFNKYYVYDTYNKEKFKIGDKYNIDVYKHGNILETVSISRFDSARVLEEFSDEEFIQI